MTQKYLPFIWPQNPALSILLLALIGITLMYFSRNFAHKIIKSFFKVIHNSLRLASKSVLIAEKKLATRNREVLLGAGMNASEREIEREFHRVDAVVRRDLQGYPALHRKMGDLVTHIDRSYTDCTEVPPEPPEWINAIAAVAKIQSKGNTLVSDMLGQINRTLQSQHKEVISEFQKSSRERQKILKKMAPYWRKLSRALEDVGKTVNRIFDRASVIDSWMREYEEIHRRTDTAERRLSSSSMTQFFISGFVMLIAIGGAVINFNLIALPMSEMVGGGSYIGPFKTADVAALVIILVEAAMGIYLMESLRITRLFPLIGSLDDKLRKRMIWITLTILIVLASIEAALAFMRDMIAADIEALRQSLAGVDAMRSGSRWIPTVGQMVMGFVLPFALAFVAIPLESFVHSGRTVSGVVLTGLLRIIAFLLRFTGNIARYMGDVMVNLYDLLVFPFLWVEKSIRERGETQKSHPKTVEKEFIP